MDISKYRIDLPKLPSKALQMTLLWHAWKGVSQIGPSQPLTAGNFIMGMQQTEVGFLHGCTGSHLRS